MQHHLRGGQSRQPFGGPDIDQARRRDPPGQRRYRKAGQCRGTHGGDAAADWFAGGQSLAEQSLASFWLDVHVSEGTNTKDEKAAYLAALFQRMGELLGPLHE